MSHPKLSNVVAKAEKSLEPAIERLSGFLKIPAISCDPAHKGDVKKLAEHVRDDLKKVGFENCRLLEMADAHPCVAAEWMKAGPKKPTVLIYGHLDLQPVKGEAWDTPPHEPTRKGERLYGRGSADDMGGWVSHLVSLEAWLSEAGELPLNVKLLIEGEEEIGSPNLEKFMDKFPEAFTSDVMVLTDCENPSPEQPGLTVSLRGLLEVEVVCEGASSDVHSGLWGNIVPDPAMSLVKLLARLVDDDGRMCLARQPVDAAWLKASFDVPLDDKVISDGAHLLPGVKPLPNRDLSPAAWIWRQPAVTILSTTFPPPGSEKNAIRKRAGAILSFRLAPGQTRETMLPVIKKALGDNVPGACKVTVTERAGGSMAWDYQPKGEAFAAADRAYEKAWGKKLLQIGVGGSIPFVALFGRKYATLPLILNGVMDPQTTAHGPNESLHLGVFKKAILANVYLMDELSSLPGGGALTKA
ncbi:MAG TPA: M20/M25/M40 family metallo-hydrolase [Myxococcota bacterium]|jgi:acetylornithine deacetylase/succinyl-diaminopimelate desuccinylase-like protein